MGKGSNAQKKASVRERKRKEMEGKGEGGGGKEGLEKRTGQLAQKILCKICKTSFLCTQSKVQLQGHLDARHEGKKFEECFPDYKETK